MTAALDDPEVTTDGVEEFAAPCCVSDIPMVAGVASGPPKRCENAAKWAGQCPACGDVALVCQDHLHMTPTWVWRCGVCSHTFPQLINLRPL